MSHCSIKNLIALTLLLLILDSNAVAGSTDPRELIDSTISVIRTEVLRDSTELQRNPTYAAALVERTVVPNVDMRLTSRLVLGKHWKGASDSQREAFIAGLQGLLVRVFATHITDYAHAEVEFAPTKFHGDSKRRATVRTSVSRAPAPTLSVDFRLRLKDGEWKVYDVALFGISLVKTYHITIAEDLKKHGLDGVIAQINDLMPLPAAAAVAGPSEQI